MNYHFPNECCTGLSNMDFGKAQIPGLYIDWLDKNLWIALAVIGFNPVYWNVMARWEYRTHSLSRAVRSRHVACCLLAASIFCLGIVRNIRFNNAMDSQPQWYVLHQNWALYSGYLCLLLGIILVVASFLALGFYGTFLGDYFGILMNARVTSFPFNVLEDPMYWGSTLNFVGCALIKGSQAGLFLAMMVGVMYKIASLFEGPFTSKIYAEKARGNRKLLNKQA